MKHAEVQKGVWAAPITFLVRYQEFIGWRLGAARATDLNCFEKGTLKVCNYRDYIYSYSSYLDLA